MSSTYALLFCYHGVNYHFEGVLAGGTKQDENKTKEIFLGHFIHQAPGDLILGKTYCLKRIHATDPSKSPCSATRELYDLLRFKGNHLRELLCFDDTANKIRKLISTNRSWEGDCICLTIEECGTPTNDLFKNCSRYSVLDRLKHTLQYAYGCQELYSSENAIHGNPIICHRDMKARNGVLFPTAEGKQIIRLIDFATIRLYRDQSVNEFSYSDPQGSLTYRMPASSDNTSPEHVDSSIPCSEKTDVYALGMILASFFLQDRSGVYTNPLNAWIAMQKLWPNSPDDAAAPYTARFKERFAFCLENYDKHRDQESWLEKDIARMSGINPLQWENTPYIADIRKIFKNATRLDPKARTTLSTFIMQLQNLISRIEEDSSQGENASTALVDIYIFEQTNFDYHRELYTKAALAQFEKRKNSLPGVHIQALCLSYNSNPVNGMNSLCIWLGNPLYSSDRKALKSAIDVIPSVSAKGANDLLAHTIVTACNALHSNQRKHFSGEIFLFTEQVPTTANITPVKNRQQGQNFSIGDVLDYMCESGDSFAQVTAFYIKGASNDDWVNEELPILTDTPPIQNYGDDPNAFQPTEEPVRWDTSTQFYMGYDTPMILTSDGSFKCAAVVLPNDL